jgi:hypothetical protein
VPLVLMPQHALLASIQPQEILLHYLVVVYLVK